MRYGVHDRFSGSHQDVVTGGVLPLGMRECSFEAWTDPGQRLLVCGQTERPPARSYPSAVGWRARALVVGVASAVEIEHG